MSATRWIILAVVVAAGGAAGVFLWRQSAPEPVAPPAAAAAPAEPAEPHYPLPAASAGQAPEPLPALDGSDDAVHRTLADAFGKQPVDGFLVPGEFIRHFVALIDSLDRAPVPLHFRPVKHVEGLPAVSGSGDTLALDPANAQRYVPWVAALKAVDAGKAAELYLQYYPLLQKAYEDLGYPGRYFNDRLIKIIDHLLDAPAIAGPIELVRPKVLYQFADPALEQRSWGQKTLIRMGPENAAAVKAKLREVRAIIAANPQPAAAPAP